MPENSFESGMELTSRITPKSRENYENTSYIPFKFQVRPKINKDTKKTIMEKKINGNGHRHDGEPSKNGQQETK